MTRKILFAVIASALLVVTGCKGTASTRQNLPIAWAASGDSTQPNQYLTATQKLIPSQYKVHNQIQVSNNHTAVWFGGTGMWTLSGDRPGHNFSNG